MHPTTPLNIALAGDHSLNLHALAFLLRQQGSFRVVSISKNMGQLMSSITDSRREDYPQIVLLDINFDLCQAAGIVSFLKSAHPGVRLAALGLTRDGQAISRLRELGVDGYIFKNSEPAELEEMLWQLAAHGAVEPSSRGVDSTVWSAVTPTERRFFRLAMSEASNEDIRRTLKLCESTFNRLVAGIYRQFGVRSRDGLVVALYRNRFMVMDDI